MPFTGPTYNIPAGTLNPAVVGTPISAADWNDFITDLEAALTDTLRASSQAFTGQVEFDPTAPEGAPAVTFTGDLNTGIFQKAADEVGISTGGTERMLVKNAGVDVTGVLDVSGDTTVGGDITVTGVVIESGRAAMQESASSVTFSHTGDTTETAIDDGANPITLTITSTGRPIMVGLQPVGAAGLFGSQLSCVADAGGERTSTFRLKRDGTAIAQSVLVAAASTRVSCLGLMMMDVPAAGAHTYTATVQGSNNAATTVATYMKIVAYEL